MSGHERASWPDAYITDVLAHQGPVGGLVSVIRALSGKHPLCRMVVIPVDTPKLQAELLRTLVSAATQSDACLFEHSPLPMVLTMTPHLAIQAHKVELDLLAGRSYSMRAFLSRLTACYLPCEKAQNEQLRNINTPQEWASIAPLCEQTR
jgi:molybdopterin-guanine dinucleotide biosynthesis protein A